MLIVNAKIRGHLPSCKRTFRYTKVRIMLKSKLQGGEQKMDVEEMAKTKKEMKFFDPTMFKSYTFKTPPKIEKFEMPKEFFFTKKCMKK